MEVCAIEIGKMNRASLETLRARMVDAAAHGAPVLLDLRNTDPSCLKYTPSLVAMIRKDHRTLAASRRVGIVATAEWARAALTTAIAMSPDVAEYLVTDQYERAHSFCVGLVQ